MVLVAGKVVVVVSCQSSVDTTQCGFAVLEELFAGLGCLVWVPQWVVAGPRCLEVVAEGASESPAPGGPAAVVFATAVLA